MSAYRSLTTLSLAALLGYGLGVVGLALGHPADLPEGEPRAALLSTLIADLQAANESWKEKSRLQREALNARDDIFAAGMSLYAPARKWAQARSRRKGSDKQDMRDLLAQCPAPSDLAPAEAFLAFSALAAGVEAHAASFAPVGYDAAKAAELRAHAQSLLGAVDSLAAADRERGEASNQRDQARAALTDAIQETEDYLKARLPEKGLAGLETLRTRYLPRYSQAAAPAAEEPTG